MGLSLPYKRRGVDAGVTGPEAGPRWRRAALAFLPTAAHRRAHTAACRVPLPLLPAP